MAPSQKVHARATLVRHSGVLRNDIVLSNITSRSPQILLLRLHTYSFYNTTTFTSTSILVQAWLLAPWPDLAYTESYSQCQSMPKSSIWFWKQNTRFSAATLQNSLVWSFGGGMRKALAAPLGNLSGGTTPVANHVYYALGESGMKWLHLSLLCCSSHRFDLTRD